MNRLAWTAFLATILIASIFYMVVSSPPSDLRYFYLVMPATVGLFGFALYVWLRAALKPRNGQSTLILIRQGALVGVVLGVLLYLQGLHVLGSVDAGLIIGAAVLLEIFFQAEKTDLRTPTN